LETDEVTLIDGTVRIRNTGTVPLINTVTGVRIRIDLMRIRIRIRIQCFYDLKLKKKNYCWKFIFYFLDQKLQVAVL